jgi:glyoxylase-like metal-dependent hydrolase (beta-lactamase superfamily II)
MLEIAKGVYQIPVMPRQTINTYLLGSVLVDAGIRSSGNKILKALNGRKLTAHALTHAHPDHQGASAFLCQKLGIPFWVSAADQAAAESGNTTATMPNPNHPIARLEQAHLSGPGHPVDKILQEGDWVEDFLVLETPGHSAGHLSFWRESDGVLIVGDVLRNMNYLTTLPKLGEPPAMYTPDIAQNRRSIQKIAALQPNIVCFGHGPALRNPQKITAFAQGISQT